MTRPLGSAAAVGRPRDPSTLDDLCEGLIEAGWLAALVVVPLWFNPFSRQSFEPDKAALVRLIAVAMAAAWTVKVAGGGRLAVPAAIRTPPRRAVTLIAPTTLLALSAVASTLASIDPRTSLAGSWVRAQGLWTTVAHLAIFALAAAHLRSAAQWRRLLYAVVTTTFGVASYAVLQRLGLDPVPWARHGERVGSTMGNPIFLGGFLALVLFPTARETAARLGSWVRARGSRRGQAPDPSAIVLGYNLILALLAVVLAQSRGPLLGLLAGAFVATLTILLEARNAAAGRWTGWRRWLALRSWSILVAATLGAISLAWAASQVGSGRLGWVRELPLVGRLAAPFDLASGTVQVRRLIWEGGLELLRQHPSRPGEEAASGTRLLFGYGPETFRLAYARYHPAALARFDDPEAAPDRGHNEALDRLVTTGLAGLAAWICWYGVLFHAAARWLFPAAAGRASLYWGCFLGGGAAGALLPVALGAPAFGFAGLAAGMVAGLTVFLVAASHPRGGAPEASRWGARETLVVALLASVTAHLIETDVGIAVTATQLYLWLLAAVVVAAGNGWLDLDGSPVPEADGTDPAPARAPLAGGLIAALALAALGFAMLANGGEARTTIGVLAANLQGRGGLGPVGAPLWLLLLTWMGAAGAASILEPSRSAGGSRGRAWRFAAISLGVGLTLVSVHAHGLAVTPRLRAAGRPLVEIVDHVAGHATTFALLVVAWTVGAGVSLGFRLGRAVRCHRPWAALAAGVATLAGGAWLFSAILSPIAAQTFLKQGAALAGAGQVEPAAALLRRACELDSGEPMHRLELGRLASSAARRAGPGPERKAWLEEARESLEWARRLSPLDPDHHANLGRLHAVAAELASDETERSAALARATQGFRTALRLRPEWVRLLAEYARVRYLGGSRDEAFDLLARALALDPDDGPTLRALASLHASEALAATEEGDAERAAEHHARAAAALASVRALGPRAER